jgi:hypothetical protein
MVVVYPIPPMHFGVLNGWFAALSLCLHAVLYAFLQYLSSLSRSWCVKGTWAALTYPGPCHGPRDMSPSLEAYVRASLHRLHDTTPTICIYSSYFYLLCICKLSNVNLYNSFSIPTETSAPTNCSHLQSNSQMFLGPCLRYYLFETTF